MRPLISMCMYGRNLISPLETKNMPTVRDRHNHTSWMFLFALMRTEVWKNKKKALRKTCSQRLKKILLKGTSFLISIWVIWTFQFFSYGCFHNFDVPFYFSTFFEINFFHEKILRFVTRRHKLFDNFRSVKCNSHIQPPQHAIEVIARPLVDWMLRKTRLSNSL